MIIETNSVSFNQVSSSDLAKSAFPAAEQLHTSEEDKTTLPASISSVGELVQKILDTSEVRQDKVETLRRAIQHSEYKLDPDKIAHALIDESR
jgi:flagellar biosynthesis anti-sigma factor FlgM